MLKFLIALLPFLGSVAGFVQAHGAAVAAAIAALSLLTLAALGIYLPTAHLRLVPVVALGLSCGLLGFLLNRIGSVPFQ